MKKMNKKELKKYKKKKGTKSYLGKAGYVYILKNPSIKNQIKIGLTQSDVYKRVQQLNSATGVPTPFKIVYFLETKDCFQLEKTMHEYFSNKRTNKRREFFKVKPKVAIKKLKFFNRKMEKEKSNFFINIAIFISFLIIGAFFYKAYISC